MADWGISFIDGLWRNAVAVVPLALLVAAICRLLPCRPATRHAMWLFILVWLVVPPILPALDAGDDAKPPEPRDSGPSRVETTSGAPSIEYPAPRSERQNSRTARKAIAQAPFDQARIERKTGAITTSAEETLPARQPARVDTAPTPPWTVDLALIHLPKRLASAANLVGSLSAQGWPAFASRLREELCAVDSTVPPSCGEGAGKRQLARTAERQSSKECADNAAPQTAKIVRPRPIPTARKKIQPSAASSPLADQLPPDPANAMTLTNAPEPRTQVAQPEPSSSLISLLTDSIQPWFIAMLQIRDAFGRLPSMPIGIWLGGILLLVACRAIQTWRVRRLLRRTRPATREMLRLVRRCANRIGLSAPPQTFITDDRVSPMIWCGLRGRLILPWELWEQLDDIGREAVVLHELAHLKRRDHWVLWMESLIGCLYWWHPVVWWVRRRLREEAENCCDAWVTWLLPRGRRAYAEALLVTRQYVSDDTPTAAVGIGIISGRARRFARRLTMVMTHRTAPNVPVSGIALALAIGVAGWLSTPAQSTERAPRADAAKVGITVTPALPAAPVAPAVPAPPAARTPPTPPAAPAIAGTPTPPVASMPPLPPMPAAAPATAWTTPMPSVPAAAVAPSVMVAAPLPPATPHAQGLLFAPAAIGPPEHDRQRQLEERLHRLEKILERLEGRTEGFPVETPAPPARSAGGKPAESSEVITERYKLSPKKLDKLTKLMVRDDVPIKVRPGEGFIEVMGTSAEHAVFRAFVNMIDAKSEIRPYSLSEGKLKALTDLMILEDVPVLVSPGQGEIKVHGGSPTQEVFAAFVNMIEPGERVSGVTNTDWVGRKAAVDAQRRQELTHRELTEAYAGRAAQNVDGLRQKELAVARKQYQVAQEVQREALERAAIEREKALKSAGKVTRKALKDAARERDAALGIAEAARRDALKEAALAREAAMQAAAEALRNLEINGKPRTFNALRGRIRDAEKEAQRLEREADRLEQEADRMRDKADQLRTRAESVKDDESAAQLEAEALALEDQAAEIEAGTEVLLAQAAEFDSLADELEVMADEVESAHESEEDIDEDDENDEDDGD